MKLGEIYDKHQGKVSDKWRLYLDVYDRIFDSYRDEPVNLLEIGIQNGGSLELWSKYFRNGKLFVGCDINKACEKLRYDDERIKVIVGDANSDEAEQKVLSYSDQYDIIIDDGSHMSGDIVRSFCRYYEYLNVGGIYIAEDLMCSYWEEYEGGLHDPYSSIGYFKKMVDIINHEHWGIDKGPSDLVKGFSERYGEFVDDAILSTIHSVEFYNSLCIIRKQAPSSNTLRERVVAGSKAAVVPRIKSLSTSVMKKERIGNSLLGMVEYSSGGGDVERCTYQQTEEISCDRSGQIHQLRECIRKNESNIASLMALLNKKDKELQKIIGSSSWKITKPIRKLSRSLRKRMRMAKDVINGRSNGAYHDSGFGSKADNNYEKWIGLYDRNDYANMPEIENGPLLSIIMPVYNPQIGYLEQAIQSVVGQVYKNWELCIADDKSDKEACIKVIEGYAKKDDRIKYLLRSENGHISAASNSAISIATGQYIVLLDQDDCIHPMALYYVAKEILEYPESAIIYSDEDKIGVDGKRCGPYFKCAFNYDLFLSHNLISHLGVYSRKIVDEVGGFRIGLEGSQDYDLALRCIERIDEKQIRHIPRVLYHWRMHENSTSTNVRSKPYAYLAARRAIGDHLCNMGVSAKVEPAPEARGACRVRYLLKDKHPSIEIVVLTRDRADLLSMCIYSVLKKTRYDNYCITIVDNGSLEPGTFELFENLKHDDRINVVRRAEPFNFSKLNNYAVGRSKSDYVCLLNNDVEVIDGDWLTEMLSHAIQDKVGAVGARLWYPDDTLQHAGVILGIGGIANNAHHKLPKGYGGYFGRAVLQQSYSAVTGACLMVSRLLYEEVGGLNEDELGVAYNDVDFCLKILAKGYRNVWTPYAELYHHESASRGREIYPEEVDRLNNESLYMKKHWGKILKNDPAYSPNLTDRNMHFSYAWPPRTVN